MKHPSTSRQRGVFTVITAIGAVLLVVILGFVVDGSRLMVIQAELQNATDACALAAAAELNGLTGATYRAAAAGSQVGGALNKKNFQAVSVDISPTTDITFSTSLNGTYFAASASSTNYKFVQCTATHNGWINVFMGLVGLADDVPVASSKAGLQQTSKVCVLPLAWSGASLRVANLETSLSSKTASQYSDLITGGGSCGISTDKRIVSVDLTNSLNTTLTSALTSRYNNDPSFGTGVGRSSRRFLAVPSVDASAKISSWVCLELGAGGSITYRGDINGPTVPFPNNNTCIASGIAGTGAIGPFTPVLVR
ncbi:TadE/TadG family type IV pilus assembly protein [Limnohabitans sp. Jir72]|uniref:TadE/TadG family type IV pilus assembly protein n=1 Tax=Limnohabitans sp. Jir72 TaxID=1977909 RepID=UPI000D3A79EE|nr:pilus assembly protein TadG-related protein [Limnohabitans sp. Jir72]PUE31381.1 hypothetical protein B9Z52_10790 [Limnohabitans sp. Jir72]